MVNRDELLRALDRVRRRNPRYEFELYRRRSERARARCASGGSPVIASLDEQGLAVRAFDGRLREGFAATSGFDSHSIDAAVASAIASIREPPGRGLERGDGAPSIDGDPLARRASEEELVSWLERVGPGLDAGMVVSVAQARVESGRIEEGIVSSLGVEAFRIRVRAWAGVEVVAESRGVRRSFAWALAGVGTDALPDPTSLADAASIAPHADRDLVLRADEPLVIAPLAAGILVRAAATRLAGGPEISKPTAAGPGWRLIDRPRAAHALVGGTFDDTGAPTGESVLADGRWCAAGIPIEGRRWRGSFRDRPEVRAAHVEVDPSDRWTEDSRGVRIEDLRLHPFPGRDWVLEGLAVRRPSGERGRVVLRVPPTQIAERCLAAVGPSVGTTLGVRTPALVFDGRGWC